MKSEGDGVLCGPVCPVRELVGVEEGGRQSLMCRETDRSRHFMISDVRAMGL